MNILVIGNGFDLAHKLPTTYQDFLRFTDNLSDYSDSIGSKQVFEMGKLVKDNTWLNHFRKLYDLNGWIEFEREISHVIQIMEKKISQYEATKEMGKGYVRFDSEEEEIMKDFDSSIVRGKIYNIKVVRDNKDRMLKDLNKLIRGLEIYLAYYVNQMVVCGLCRDIIGLDIQKVLSFNYTNTFARFYDSRTDSDGDSIHAKNGIEYDYIHGKAESDNNIDTNNMVLGIDEYLPNDRKDKDVEFIAFKKYYQRIYKGTGCKYKDWINAIREENEKYMERKHDCEIRHNLYIYGHSLDVTDRDVIRELILNDNVYTTIFYPDREELGRKIANLVKVIGQDELIRRTGGSTKTIKFELQKIMGVYVRNAVRSIDEVTRTV